MTYGIRKTALAVWSEGQDESKLSRRGRVARRAARIRSATVKAKGLLSSGLERSDKNKNAAIAGGVDSIYKLCY
jgi:hypothetical protein